MTCLVSVLTRIASCVFLYAVILYAPGLVPVFVLPKWAWHGRPDSGFARRRPATCMLVSNPGPAGNMVFSFSGDPEPDLCSEPL